jgi:hypothetical protein
MENTASDILFAEDILLNKGYESQESLINMEESYVIDKLQMPLQQMTSVQEVKP